MIGELFDRLFDRFMVAFALYGLAHYGDDYRVVALAAFMIALSHWGQE